jgi:lipoprotein-anchoring transpeptidase ErfK/SrfK
MNRKITILAGFIIVIFFAGFGLSKTCFAASHASAGIYETNGKLVRTLKSIQPGADIAVLDLGQDGVPEIIVGSPAGSKPEIKILRLDGSVIRTFHLSNVKNKPGVKVTAADVIGNDNKEIVISFGAGTTPEIQIYSADGIRLKAFLAFDENFKKGVSVSTGDVNGDGVAEIIASQNRGGAPVVVIFDGAGKKLEQFFAYPSKNRSGVDTITSDLNRDGKAEIVSASYEVKSLIKIFDASGLILQSFTSPFNPKTVSASSVLNQLPEIILGSAPGTTATVASYFSDGTPGHVKFTPFGNNFKNGMAVAAANIDGDSDPEIIVAPGATIETAPIAAGSKSIKIDISEQRLYRYENGKLIATHMVSTGKWAMPTPIGSFQVRSKITTAYSRRYRLYMDNWMAITPDGAYGIHSLPYWRLKNGGIYYEGVAHLGKRVSHGCVRLSPKESAEVFKWTGIGTPVTIQN